MDMDKQNVAISDKVFDGKDGLLEAISKIVLTSATRLGLRGETPQQLVNEILAVLNAGGDASFVNKFSGLMAQLHSRELNPLFEYTSTFDDISTASDPKPPAGLGWTLNRNRGVGGITRYPAEDNSDQSTRAAFHWKRIPSDRYGDSFLTGLAESMDVRRFASIMNNHYAQTAHTSTKPLDYLTIEKLLSTADPNRQYGLLKIPASNPQLIDGFPMHQEATYMLLEFASHDNAPTIQILTTHPGNTGLALYRMHRRDGIESAEWKRWSPELLLPISEARVVERIRDF
jgi:hypothetical protein